jgi:acetylornithine/succinyldiaminopimelate/putrescine aminotransferase
MHASTFGGNPIAARAGIAAIETIDEERLLEHAQSLGNLFQQRLAPLADSLDIVREVRVLGVMIGIELSVEGAPVVQKCLERGLLINCTHGTVLRLLPAMNLTEELAHEGCDVLTTVLTEFAGQ